MISRTLEYALRAAVWLAGQNGQPRTAQAAAAATQVPEGYMSKVLQLLVAARLANSRRGLGGGFTLARPAHQITVLDVVNAVEPIQRIERCPLRLPAHASQLCPLHQKVDDALAQIERAFAGTAIADLIGTWADSEPVDSSGCATGAVGAKLTVGGQPVAARAEPKRRGRRRK